MLYLWFHRMPSSLLILSICYRSLRLNSGRVQITNSNQLSEFPWITVFHCHRLWPRTAKFCCDPNWLIVFSLWTDDCFFINWLSFNRGEKGSSTLLPQNQHFDLIYKKIQNREWKTNPSSMVIKNVMDSIQIFWKRVKGFQQHIFESISLVLNNFLKNDWILSLDRERDEATGKKVQNEQEQKRLICTFSQI